MSIALQRNNSGGGHHPIEGPGFVHREMAYVSPAYDSPEAEEEDLSDSLSSSSSSSIGKNSDEHPGGGSDEEEVQSEYKEGPLDSLESLEEVLPVKYVIIYLFI